MQKIKNWDKIQIPRERVWLNLNTKRMKLNNEREE